MNPLLAEQFLEPARELGFNIWTGVPCSYLKPFINYVIDDGQLTYVSSANEGDAVATASGAALAGQRTVAMMQNSGLGNAVSPLTSLNWVFRLPVLLIVTLRGDPDLGDEPQHQLMGRITTRLLETMEIEWQWFPTDPGDVRSTLNTATAHMDRTGLPYALVLRKGSIAKHELKSAADTRRTPGSPVSPGRGRHESPTRQQVLQQVVDNTDVTESIVIGSTGYNGRELYAIDDRHNHFYMVGSMGCASSFGLGLSLARPDLDVVVCDGDGGSLMRMGNLATVGACGGQRLRHLVLDNGIHESTGGQATVSGTVRFERIAAACAYRRVERYDGLDSIGRFLHGREGPSFMHVRTQKGVASNLPRPGISPAGVKQRLMRHIDAVRGWTGAGT